jgi:hypothetical protein
LKNDENFVTLLLQAANAIKLLPMKQSMLTFFLGLCLVIFATAQTKEEKVKSIDTVLERLIVCSADDSLTLVNEEFMPHMTDGGGSLTAFYKEKHIYRIREQIGLSYGIITTDYYLQNDKLVCAVETERSFPVVEESGERDHQHPVQVYTGKFYFEGDLLLYTVKIGKRTFDDELYFDSQTKEGSLLSSLQQYLALFAAKNK